MLIATLPAVHQEQLLHEVISHPGVEGVRYNVGAKSAYTPKETLERILALTTRYRKRFWVDLKGRQLRIVQWAAPVYGRIILNHEVEVDCPAVVIFRGDDRSEVKVARGNTIYVDPPPRHAVGEGQAINLQGNNLRIMGYLTPEDEEYLAACRALGINDIMLSFVEELQDIKSVQDLLPTANLVLKIESPKGVDFIKSEALQCNAFTKINLMAARDDLYVNVGPDGIFPALQTIIEKDPEAILASRIFTSLEQNQSVSLSDLSDVVLMRQMGYQHFMFSDGLCQRHFGDAMGVWKMMET